MKVSSFLLTCFVAIALTACGDDDNETKPVEPSKKAETVLPIVKEYSQEEFSALFVGGLWQRTAIHDVYADGKTGDNILSWLDGMGAIAFYAKSANELRYHVSIIDPTEPDVNTDVTFSYANQNALTIDRNIINGDKGATAYTVLEVNDSIMRLLGPAYPQKREPEAVNGLYIFHRLSKDDAETTLEKWDKGEKW